MQFTIEHQTLLKSLAKTQSIVERNSTIAILANVLIQADDRVVKATATDMDLALDQEFEATVDRQGSITVSAQRIHDFVRRLPDGSEIKLDLGENGELSIMSSRSECALRTMSSADFPLMDAGELPHQFSLPAETLGKLIDRTRFAMSTEETRYYLNGIFLHAATADSGPVLRLVATDGHRLAMADEPLPDGAADIPGHILPRKAVNELRKLLDEASPDSVVTVALSDTKARFTFDSSTLTTKLIDGTFPDYTRVIPVENQKELKFHRDEFNRAVDRVAIVVSEEKARIVKLALGNDNLVISATSINTGSAREDMDVSYSDLPMEIGFNARYLLDITQQIDGDEAVFMLADGASPALVHDTADPNVLYVLMPMRV